MTSRQDENLHLNQMRRKLRTYSNQDYIFINSTNIHRYNAMYKIFKEITIKGIERTFGVHRSEWFNIDSAYQKPILIIKSRKWFCFFMNYYFNVAIVVYAPDMGLSKSRIKHYIINLGEDKSLETRAEYNQILTNIFLTDAEIDTGIKTYEI